MNLALDASDISENRVKPTCRPSASEIREIELLSQPMLKKYWPSERRAVLVHRFYLSLELKREATLEETVRSWESGICLAWRRDKMRRDGQEQLKEIEKHKYFLSQRLGHDAGWEAAARDWIEHHAAAWREWWEEQPNSGA